MKIFIRNLIVVLMAVLTMCLPVCAEDLPLQDMPRSFWAYREIEWCLEKGFMTSENGLFFYPDKHITVGEAITSTLKARGETVPQDEADFAELALDKFPQAVQKPEDLKNTFTRETACYILMSDENISDSLTLTTADAEEAEEKYRKYMAACIKKGVFVPDDFNKAYPDNLTTRAMFAMMLTRTYMSDYTDSELGKVAGKSALIIIPFVLIILLIKKKQNWIKDKKINSNLAFAVLLLFAAAIRLAIGTKYYGFASDINFWKRWSQELYENGLYNIYSISDVDYPPGYLYILYLTGWFTANFDIGHIVYKLPAMCFDIALIVIAHKIASRHISDRATLLMVDFMAALGSPMIIDSALWGQVDVIYMVFMVLCIDCIMHKKMKRSYFWYAIATIVKPQSLVLAPILLLGIYENVLKDFNWRSFWYNLAAGLGAVLLMVLLAMPFNLENVIQQYGATLASYPYFSVGAFNVYSMVGLDFCILPEWYSLVNTAILALISVGTAIYFFKGNKNYYFLAAILSFGFFMLSTKIHERYCFPVIVMFLMAYIYDNSKENLFCLILSMITFDVNTLCIYLLEQTTFTGVHTVLSILCFVNVAIFVYTLVIAAKKWSFKKSHVTELKK